MLGVIFLIATIIGSIVCFRRKAAERRRRQAEEGALEVFGNPRELVSYLQLLRWFSLLDLSFHFISVEGSILRVIENMVPDCFSPLQLIKEIISYK